MNINNQIGSFNNNSFLIPFPQIGLKDLLERDFLIEDLGKMHSGNNNFLHLAAQSSDFELVEDLFKKIIEKKLDINDLLFQKNSEGKTPLHLVFENKNKEIIELFIQIISGKSSSLHTWMSQKNFEEIEDFLTNCPSDFCRAQLLNIENSEECTLFNLALEDDELIHLCLSSFKHSEERFNFVMEPLESHFNNNMFMFLEGGKLNIKKMDAFFGFFIHDLDKLKALLSECNENNSTPLHLVIEEKNVDCISKILAFIKLLEVQNQEEILFMEDDGGHIPLNVLAYVKNVDKNVREDIISLIYNAADRTTQKKMLHSQDNEGNTFFHLLASKVEGDFSRPFVVNCRLVFGDLMTKLKLSIVELVKLSKIKNEDGKRPLEKIS